MLGFNSQQVYEDELGDLNDRGTDIEFDLGDRFRQAYGVLIGKDYSKQGLLEGAAKIRNEELDKKYGTRSRALELGPLNSSYQGAAGKTETELKIGYEKDLKRETALQNARATGDLDIDSLSPNASAGEILGAANTGTRKREEEERTTRLKESRDREDSLLERAELREDRRDLRQDKRLAQERLLAAETNQMNLQFKYAQLAQSERVRAQDRKDRAIMTLISGLGNLGAAFAI